METKFIQSLTKNFESFVHKTEEGLEFWLARDLQHLLGYSKWDNFQNVISKAKTACELSGAKISDHFADVGKTIEMPKNAQKEIDDIMGRRILNDFELLIIKLINNHHFPDVGKMVDIGSGVQKSIDDIMLRRV